MDNPQLCETARQCKWFGTIKRSVLSFFIFLFLVEMTMATFCKVQYTSVMLHAGRTKDPQQAGFSIKSKAQYK